MDTAKIEEGVRLILEGVGEDPDREGLRETPARVAYVPNPSGQICGISKLARLVDLFARRPQVQERLTSQVADTLVKELDPQGVLVVLECEHLCMSMRGIKKPGSKTTTSAVRGSFITSAETRAEALSLIRQGR